MYHNCLNNAGTLRLSVPCDSRGMTTALDRTLKRELSIDGRAYTVTLSPEGLTLALKGRRKGVQLVWRALISGEAALAVALNASLGRLPGEPVLEHPARASPLATSAAREKVRVAKAARPAKRTGDLRHPKARRRGS
jgi:hypothetical protein